MDEREKIFQFKQNAKYFAKSRGTIGDMERAVGVSPGYLSRDLKSLNMTVVLRIAKYLDMSVDELLNPKSRFEAEARRVTKKLEEKEQERLKNKWN